MKEKIYAFYSHYLYPFQATVTIIMRLTKICMEIRINSGNKQTKQKKLTKQNQPNKKGTFWNFC